MKTIKNLLQKELKKYRYYLKKSNSEINEEIKGSLQIAKREGYDQYYHLVETVKCKKKRVYIKSNNVSFAKKLAKQSYLKTLNSLSKKRVSQFEAFLSDYNENELFDLYNHLSPSRKKLFKPVVIDHETKVSTWKNKPFQPKGFTDDAIFIQTNKGERVRSKTEKILADKFFELGIEYKYECPLILKDGTKFYPDFTFIHPVTFEEIYWEHHGMMNNPHYFTKTIRKIATYEKNGIFRNQRLIVTYESSDHNLDYRWVDILIKKFLLQ